MSAATIPINQAVKVPAKMRMPLVSLNAALDKISPALPGPSSPIPILRNVRIENVSDGVTFTATDLDLSIRAKVTGSNDVGSPYLLSSERFLSYVKLLEGEQVSIAPGKTRASLLCGRSKTQLPLDQIANYPETVFGVDLHHKPNALKLPQSLALRMFKYTAFAISQEESRYTLNGALLACEAGRLVMVTTDGHRLAIYSAPVGESSQFAPYLLPSGLMKAAGRAIADDAALAVWVADEDPNLTMHVEGITELYLTHRKLSGQFPNYKAVVPAVTPVWVRVNAIELLAALGRCLAMSDRTSHVVKMTVSGSEIVLLAKDAQAGEAEETVSVYDSGDNPAFSTGFNGTYLVDALKRIKGDVTLGWAKGANNVAMKMSASPEDGETFEYVVMPMRVS